MQTMKHSSLQTVRRCATLLVPMLGILPANAEVIFSNLKDLTIPNDFDGVYLDVETGNNDTTGGIDWDLNFVYGGTDLYNSPNLQPVRQTDSDIGTLSNLSAGTTVNSSSTYDSNASYGASEDHMGSTFTAGVEGYIGFQLSNGNHGWMRVNMNGTGTSQKIIDWAYDNSGSSGSIATGNVTQSGSTVTVDSSAGSFTLGSALSSTQALTKTGSNTVTLNADSTNSGATTVSSGMLLVNSVNSGATGAVTVESGATLGGSGTIGGATTIESGGFLAAGNSPGVLTFGGDLTLDGGSTTTMEITGTTRGTQYDGIDVGGLLSYGGALTITSDSTITQGSYDLFGINGTEGGDFASITLSGTAYANNVFAQAGDIWTASVGVQTYTFSQLTGDLTVVPEPNTFALLAGLATLAQVTLRRPRRR